VARAALPRWVAGANPKRTALRVVIMVALAVLVFRYVLLPVRGVGVSMEPTITEGDLLFVSRVTYRFRDPKRGDVVAVRIAGQSVVLVKRIVALPGEQVDFRAGILHIDGAPLAEPYVKNRSDWNLTAGVLGGGEYFVVGDNRAMAMRLHELGAATRQRLIGPKLF